MQRTFTKLWACLTAWSTLYQVGQICKIHSIMLSGRSFWGQCGRQGSGFVYMGKEEVEIWAGIAAKQSLLCIEKLPEALMRILYVRVYTT